MGLINEKPSEKLLAFIPSQQFFSYMTDIAEVAKSFLQMKL